MSKLAVKLAYENKQGELRGLVEVEARRLQGVKDTVQAEETKLREIQKEKTRIGNLIDKMEKDLTGKREEWDSLTKKKAEMDIFEEQVKDLLGRLSSYKTAVTETVEYANEELKKNGIPLTFGLPPDKLIEVDMFNFDQDV